MASIIEGYTYDIFISYRQKDNKGDRWVSEFVDALKDELESTFKEEISVYFDINPHDGLLETHDVDESLKEKLKCLVFIPIISRTYCDPKSFAWEHEFKVFVDQAAQDQFGLKVKLLGGNVASRVLPVQIHDLDKADIKLCESVLGGVLRGIEFIYKEPGVNKPLTSEDDDKNNLNKTKYRIQINKTANAIKEVLSGIKTEISAPVIERSHHEKPLRKVSTKKEKEKQLEIKRADEHYQPVGEMQEDLRVIDNQSKESGEIFSTSKEEVTALNVASFRRKAFWVITTFCMVILAIVVGVITWDLTHNVTKANPKRFVIFPPSDMQLYTAQGSDINISPDGNYIIYPSNNLLIKRPINSFEVTPISGTESGCMPFFSPDGVWIGYYSASKQTIMKIPLAGGLAVPVCPIKDAFSASWAPNDMIFIGTRGGQGIAQVSAKGGEPEFITKVDTANGEINHDSPILLADGKVLVYSIIREGSLDESLIVAKVLATGEQKTLAKGASNIKYSPTGHLVYNRLGTLYAATFNPKKLEVGSWTPIEENIRRGMKEAHPADFSFSNDGILVYVHGWTYHPIALVWADRKGDRKRLMNKLDYYQDFQISPDGNRVALQLWDSTNNQSKIWVYDLNLGSFDQLTFEGDNFAPIWTPDGENVTFITRRSKTYSLCMKRWDASSEVEELWKGETELASLSWSQDGKWLAFVRWNPETKYDIWKFSKDDKTISPYLVTKDNERNPKFSPKNGSWIAYDSNESGKREVYVRTFEDADGLKRISTTGGFDPLWAPNGQEMYYQSENRLMSVSVESKLTVLQFGASHPLFNYKGLLIYDVHPNEDSFLLGESDNNTILSIRVVLNWFDELKSLVPED